MSVLSVSGYVEEDSDTSSIVGVRVGLPAKCKHPTLPDWVAVSVEYAC